MRRAASRGAPAAADAGAGAQTTPGEAGQRSTGRWTWRRWRAELELAPGPHEIAVRAWDASGATQPEGLRAVWNARGYMNNAWHRIGVQA